MAYIRRYWGTTGIWPLALVWTTHFSLDLVACFLLRCSVSSVLVFGVHNQYTMRVSHDVDHSDPKGGGGGWGWGGCAGGVLPSGSASLDVGIALPDFFRQQDYRPGYSPGIFSCSGIDLFMLPGAARPRAG